MSCDVTDKTTSKAARWPASQVDTGAGRLEYAVAVRIGRATELTVSELSPESAFQGPATQDAGMANA